VGEDGNLVLVGIEIDGVMPLGDSGE